MSTITPMPPGPPRPGRPAAQPVAEVIDRHPARRGAVARKLREAGYFVVTCPGPLAGTLCPALAQNCTCPRVVANLQLVVMDASSAATGLPERYRAWVPDVSIRDTEAFLSEHREPEDGE